VSSQRLAPGSARAILVAAAPIAAAIGVIGFQLLLPLRSADAEPAIAPPPRTPEVAGLRADAWFLPDEPLLGFVEIPAGTFLMGSDPAADPLAYDNERLAPGGGQGVVDLPAYYIGRYPVPVAQFREFVNATGYAAEPAALRGPPDHPVVAVSWVDALAYSRWLDRTLREAPHPPPQLSDLLDSGWRVTLPTEAQWEKAARGTDGRIYPWGDAPRPDRANYLASGTTAVGSFDCPECPYGVLDMSGNVWEWTRSPFQLSPYGAGNEDLDLRADALWVMRGGSYEESEQTIRAAVRGGADPGARRDFIGFRLVLSPPAGDQG
jgi:formylglycine-generating enzyme required for sulfatase activity